MNLPPARRWKVWLAALLLALWLGAIFATSCTVVRPQEFFALVHRYILVSESSMEAFQFFWASAWLLVVKGWHFTEFAILECLCVAAIRAILGGTTPKTILGSAIFCIAFAASDEWHQTFVPDRNGTLGDVLIDSAGVLAASLSLLRRTRKAG